MLPTCSGRISIPDLEARATAWALDFFTDAAGGSLRVKGQGLGGGAWLVVLLPLVSLHQLGQSGQEGSQVRPEAQPSEIAGRSPGGGSWGFILPWPGCPGLD